MNAAGEMPCIRCGDCAPVCPAGLDPQGLLWDLRAGQLPRALASGLLDCSECGRCNQACPSHIRLADRFSRAKAEAIRRDSDRQIADAARLRFEHRNQRLQRDAIDRAQGEAALNESAASSDAVAAAIERSKARRQAPDKAP